MVPVHGIDQVLTRDRCNETVVAAAAAAAATVASKATPYFVSDYRFYVIAIKIVHSLVRNLYVKLIIIIKCKRKKKTIWLK